MPTSGDVLALKRRCDSAKSLAPQGYGILVLALKQCVYAQIFFLLAPIRCVPASRIGISANKIEIIVWEVGIIASGIRIPARCV